MTKKFILLEKTGEPGVYMGPLGNTENVNRATKIYLNGKESQKEIDELIEDYRTLDFNPIIMTLDGSEIEYYSNHVLEYKRVGDVGLDLRAANDIVIKPGESVLIKTGTLVKLPQGYGAFVLGRSGLTRKTKLRVNTGTIDTNYRGEIGVMAENTDRESKTEKALNKVKEILGREVDKGKRDIVINRGDRVAQLVPFAAHDAQVIRKSRAHIENDKTERGANGYGSSGLK